MIIEHEVTEQEIIIEKGINVPMRDGVFLATDVYRPLRKKRAPVLLTRLPYNKDYDVFQWITPERACAAGFVVVVQDTRGRYASGGEFTHPFVGDAEDGADTIAWLAEQAWCSGDVGMFGLSGQGMTQWMAASEQPAALKAIAPMFCPAEMTPYRDGVFQLGPLLWWTVTQGARGEVERRLAQGRATQDELDALTRADVEIETLYTHTPANDLPLLEPYAPYYFEWLNTPLAGEDARAAQKAMIEAVRVPALHIGGWYDLFMTDILSNYVALREREKQGLAAKQRLIVGPWAHLEYPGVFDERDFGPTASTVSADVVGAQLRWFDHWLNGNADADAGDARVRIFVMGADVWRDEDEYPLPDTQYCNYYLHSGGHANTLAGDGELSRNAPTDEPVDSFDYDPRNPVRTIGGANLLSVFDENGEEQGFNTGPRDQRALEERADVLCYTTPPLTQPLEVTGPIELVVALSSSAKDTDVTGKLVDVYPDGRAEILTDGIMRVRYRKGDGTAQLMEPANIYEVRVNVGATSNVFRAGHRIRLEISSSNFPRFDRNTNTGGAIVSEHEREFVTAHNQIHHTAAHPSYLILPIIER